jgi:hypothetical protein
MLISGASEVHLVLGMFFWYLWYQRLFHRYVYMRIACLWVCGDVKERKEQVDKAVSKWGTSWYLCWYWYICYLQLGWHTVAAVQYTFTHKEYTERQKKKQCIEKHKKQNIEQNKNIIGTVRAVPRLCELYPGICLTTEEKARRNLIQGSWTITIHRPNIKNTQITALNRNTTLYW